MTIAHKEIFEDAGATLMARIVGNSGAPITQAGITSIACKVIDLDGDTPATAVLTPSISVSAVISDTLQTTDTRWTADAMGYNFLHAMPATAFPSPRHRYVVQYTFTPTSGAVFVVEFDLKTRRVW